MRIKERIKKHSKIIENLSALVVVQLLLAGAGFFTRVKLSSVLGKEVFGDFSYALVLGTYGVIFIQFGLDRSFVRDLVHYRERFGELIKASLFLRFILFLILMVFFGFTAPVLLKSSSPLGTCLIVFSSVMLAFNISGVYDVWHETRRQTIYFFIQRSFYLSLVWIAVLVPVVALSLELLGVLLILASLMGLSLEYRWALPRIEFVTHKGLFATTGFLVRSNVWLWLALLFSMSFGYLNQIMLKHISGSADLGVYSVSWIIVSLAVLFLHQVIRIGRVLIAGHTKPEIHPAKHIRFLVRYIALMFGAGALLGLPCILFSEIIVTTFFKPEYTSASGVLRILGFYPMLYGPYLVALQYIISVRMQKMYFVLSLIMAAVSIGLCFWLIPLYQSVGAAIALIISLGVSCFLYLVVIFVHLRDQSNVSDI